MPLTGDDCRLDLPVSSVFLTKEMRIGAGDNTAFSVSDVAFQPGGRLSCGRTQHVAQQNFWPWMRVPRDKKKIIKVTNSRFAEKLLDHTGVKVTAISHCFFYHNR